MAISSLYNTFHHSIWGCAGSYLRAAQRTTRKMCGNVHQKMKWIRDNYLTRSFIYSKTRNALKAKVRPLSNPPGWEEKIKMAHTKLARLKTLRSNQGNVLKKLKQTESVRSKNTPFRDQTAVHQQQIEMLETQCQKLDYKIKEQEQLINYLEKQRMSQVSSRFIGYLGMASNAALPGSGTALGVALTGASIVTQEKLTSLLPEDPAIRPQEQRNVRWSTYLTVACTTGSIAFSILVWPTIKRVFLAGSD